MRWVARALLLVLATAACHSAKSPSPSGTNLVAVSSGGLSLIATDGGFPLVLSGDGGALLTLEADSFRVGRVRALDDTLSYDPYWLLYSDSTFTASAPPGMHWTQPTSFAVADAGPNALGLDLAFDDGSQGEVVFTPGTADRLDARLIPDSSSPVAFLAVRLHVTSTERFYGLGEWFDSVEHRGKLRPMQLEPDLNLESSDTENHVTVPLLLSTLSWGVFVDSRRPGVFDVASSDPTQVDVIFGTAADSSAGLPFHLFTAPTPADLVHHYFDLTGAPRLPAPWALGPLLWRDNDNGQAQVESDIDQIRTLGLATSGLWLDRPYATAIETFDFVQPGYPDAGAMIAHAHAAGLRMGAWHAPYSELAAEPFHDEIVDAGYFPPVTGTQLNPWSPPLDFTNPAAVSYWQSNLGIYASVGIEGFKLDYGEDIIPGVGGGRDVWQFADGSDERTESSLYSVLYHRTYAALLPADGGFLLCRAGHWGDQVSGPIIWPGDLDATMTSIGESFAPVDGGATIVGVGGLPSALNGGLSLAVSGFPFFAADTGGYRHAPADKETWIRWVEQSALGTAMETGDGSSQMPWDRDAESLSVYQTFAALHLRLFPYVWTFAQSAAQSGRPILQPLGFAFPAMTSPPGDEYVLGELLVAPVATEGAVSRSITFPPGTWISWWDGSTHTGTETFAAPLDTLPLFAAQGAVIPLLRPSAVTLAPAADPSVDSFGNDPGILTAMLFAGTGSFTVYDGTALTQTPTTLQISPGSTFTEGVAVTWMGLGTQPSAVMDGSTSLSGWTWSASGGGTLAMRLEPGPHTVVLSP